MAMVHGTKWRRNIAENFNRLTRAHERYRQKTDGQTTTYSELNIGVNFAIFSLKFMKFVIIGPYVTALLPNSSDCRSPSGPRTLTVLNAEGRHSFLTYRLADFFQFSLAAINKA